MAEAEETGRGMRTSDQVTDKEQRLIRIIQIKLQKQSGQEFSDLALTNQVVSVCLESRLPQHAT